MRLSGTQIVSLLLAGVHLANEVEIVLEDAGLVAVVVVDLKVAKFGYCPCELGRRLLDALPMANPGLLLAVFWRTSITYMYCLSAQFYAELCGREAHCLPHIRNFWNV